MKLEEEVELLLVRLENERAAKGEDETGGRPPCRANQSEKRQLRLHAGAMQVHGGLRHTLTF